MFRSTLLRGVSAGALTLVLFSRVARAQETLPVIEIQAANSGGIRTVASAHPG